MLTWDNVKIVALKKKEEVVHTTIVFFANENQVDYLPLVFYC